MMMLRSLLLAALLGAAAGQRQYPNPPDVAWTAVGGETKQGNGLFLSPDGSMVVGSFLDGSLIMYDAETGSKIGTYTPTVTNGATIRGYGGVTFVYTAPEPYLLYAVTENPFGEAQTRVLALSPSGETILDLGISPGVQSGTPLATYDGRYILMNANQGNMGYFNLYDKASGNSAQYSIDSPFGPLGGFLRPAEGYYDGGQNNTNDIFVFGQAMPSNATSVGEGQLYAFQLDSPNSSLPLLPFELGPPQAFEMSTPPVLTNEGRSMYITSTKAEQRCWVGTGLDRDRLNRGRTEQFGLTRGSPQYISARAPPTLSSDSETPTVYGPGAAAEIWKADYNYSSYITANTTGIVSGRVHVSPDGAYIYYGTQDGNVVQADANDLTTVWSLNLSAPIEGEMALNHAGTMLYVADSAGAITAYTVAIGDSTTTAPTVAPTATPRPTMPTPSTAPTKLAAPTKAPTSTSGAVQAERVLLPVAALLLGALAL